MSSASYRQEAIDAHARMAALPKAMRATSGMVRASVLGVFLSLMGALIASAYIKIPIQAPGRGVVIDAYGELLHPVNVAVSGFVEAIFVKPGDPVHAGQPLMRIHVPEKVNEIEKADRELAGLMDEDRRMSGLEAQDEDDESRTRDQKAASLSAEIARLERRLDWLREREAAEKHLVADGLSTQDKLMGAKVAVQDATDQIETARDDRDKLFAQTSEAANKRKKEKLGRQLKITQLQAELATLRRDCEERAVLRSASEGAVAEVAASVGAAVAPGQVLLNVAPARPGSAVRNALVYVPLGQGKRVKVGDPVQLLLSSLDEQDRDRAKGRVVSITPTVATRPSMLRQLGSEQLFNMITRDGPVFEVTVEFDRDPDGAGGLAWTSGKGPEGFALSLGTPLSAMVTIERSSLLSLLVPALRKLLDPQADPWSAKPTAARA